MKRISIIVILLVSLVAFSCRVKQSCEINHTGNISVINHYNSSVEVRVNNEKIGVVDNGKVLTVEKPLGSYDINVVKYPNVWDTTVVVDECKAVEFIVE